MSKRREKANAIRPSQIADAVDERIKRMAEQAERNRKKLDGSYIDEIEDPVERQRERERYERSQLARAAYQEEKAKKQEELENRQKEERIIKAQKVTNKLNEMHRIANASSIMQELYENLKKNFLSEIEKSNPKIVAQKFATYFEDLHLIEEGIKRHPELHDEFAKVKFKETAKDFVEFAVAKCPQIIPYLNEGIIFDKNKTFFKNHYKEFVANLEEIAGVHGVYPTVVFLGKVYESYPYIEGVDVYATALENAKTDKQRAILLWATTLNKDKKSMNMKAFMELPESDRMILLQDKDFVEANRERFENMDQGRFIDSLSIDVTQMEYTRDMIAAGAKRSGTSKTAAKRALDRLDDRAHALDPTTNKKEPNSKHRTTATEFGLK